MHEAEQCILSFGAICVHVRLPQRMSLLHALQGSQNLHVHAPTLMYFWFSGLRAWKCCLRLFFSRRPAL